MAKKRKPTSKRKQKLINAKISAKAQKRSIEKKLASFPQKDLSKTQKHERNELLTRAVGLNTIIYDADVKLDKLTKRKRPVNNFRAESDEDSLRVVLGNYWHKADIEDYIAKHVNSLNGHSMKKDADAVFSTLNEAYNQMGNYDYISVSIDMEDNATLHIVHKDDIEDDNEIEFL